MNHRRRGVTLVLATLIGLSALALPAQAGGSEGTAKGSRSATAKKPAPAPTPTVAPSLGVALPGVPHDLAALTTLTQQLGKAPTAVTWYDAWSNNADFPAAAASRVAATGATPEVTWEPWDPALGVDQPAYALDRIAAGDHDAYVVRWAQQLRAYGKPVVLRFAHEMNGTWYPWAEGVNTNGAGDYATAWRHVVDVFRAQGATNVVWRWSPNVPYTGSTALSGLYPGDAHVDQVALDGYNWGTLQPYSTWQSFADVFAVGRQQVRALTAKPLFIGETAAPEAGGDKAAWIRDMHATLAANPDIRGITWFHYNKEADWRIDSSQASLDAFRAGVGLFG